MNDKFQDNLNIDHVRPDEKITIIFIAKNLPHFSCQYCGQCCQSLTVPITEDEFYQLKTVVESKSIVEEKHSVRERYFGELKRGKNGICTFLHVIGENNSKRVCSVYDNRPFACRLFPYKYTIRSDDKIELGIHTGAEFFCRGLDKTKTVSIRKKIVFKRYDYQKQTIKLKQTILDVINDFLI